MRGLVPFAARQDWALVASALLLAVLGIALLATGGAESARTLAVRQGVFLAAGVALLLFFSRVHYSLFRSLTGAAYLGVLVLLVLTLVQAHAIRGAAAWLVIGGQRLQAGEFMKVALVLVLARIVSGNLGARLSGRRLAAALLAAAVPMLLILRQPDFGTAALLGLVTFGMLAARGLSRRQWMLLLGGGAVLAVLAWSTFLAEYQKERLRVFLNPGRDPYGAGYAVLQARTAFGSGGLTGRGLGWGPQSRLNFLPEVHTDFVFARIGEELGLVGVVVTLGLFGVVQLRMLRAADRTSDAFGRALAVGCALTLLIGLAVNAGMNVGLLPVTGVPLPFLSYGGSSLLTSFLLLGIAASVVVHGERWESAEAEAALIEASA